jgi:hypothetical protein
MAGSPGFRSQLSRLWLERVARSGQARARSRSLRGVPPAIGFRFPFYRLGLLRLRFALLQALKQPDHLKVELGQGWQHDPSHIRSATKVVGPELAFSAKPYITYVMRKNCREAAKGASWRVPDQPCLSGRTRLASSWPPLCRRLATSVRSPPHNSRQMYIVHTASESTRLL